MYIKNNIGIHKPYLFSFFLPEVRKSRELCGEEVTNPRRVRPRGYNFFFLPFSEASSRAKRSEAVPPSEAARLHRAAAKRGSAERSEAVSPRLRRAKRGRAKVIGRSPLQKNSKRFHQKSQGNHLFLFSTTGCHGPRVKWRSKTDIPVFPFRRSFIGKKKFFERNFLFDFFSFLKM